MRVARAGPQTAQSPDFKRFALRPDWRLNVPQAGHVDGGIVADVKVPIGIGMRCETKKHLRSYAADSFGCPGRDHQWRLLIVRLRYRPRNKCGISVIGQSEIVVSHHNLLPSRPKRDLR